MSTEIVLTPRCTGNLCSGTFSFTQNWAFGTGESKNMNIFRSQWMLHRLPQMWEFEVVPGGDWGTCSLYSPSVSCCLVFGVKVFYGGSRMVQQVEVLATKPVDLGFYQEPCSRRKGLTLWVLLWLPHMSCGMCLLTHASAHTHVCTHVCVYTDKWMNYLKNWKYFCEHIIL